MDIHFLADMIITDFYYTLNPYTEQGVGNKRTNRPCWSIVMKYEGETVYTANGKTYLSDANHIILLPRGSSYEWVCTKSGKYASIEFECNLETDEIFSIPTKNATKVLSLMKEMEYKQAIKSFMYKQEIIKSVYALILSITTDAKQTYTPSEKLHKLTPAIDYMATHYNKRVKNEEFAKLTGLSTAYFRRLFTEVMGTSPIHYMIELRMKKAQEMLKSDYGSINNIAFSLGYASIYDFSRDFKKYTGFSPSKYQQLC